MAGSMRQRGRGCWELRVYLGLDPDTRQRRYATRTVHGTRLAATAALADLVETTAYSRLRVRERSASCWNGGWLLRRPRGRHRRCARPQPDALPSPPAPRPRPGRQADRRRHRRRLCAPVAPRWSDDRPLGPATVHRVHVVLRRALSQAVRWEWIWLNPAALASPPRVEPADIRPPSVEQIRRLLDVVRAEDIDFFTYLHLAVMTGARRSQLLAWSDVDFNHAALGFCRALVDGPTGPVLRPTKNRRTYRVALDPRSVELLLAHRDQAATRTAGVVDGFVFSRDAGRHPWRPNWVTKRFIAYRRRAGLAAFRLHDLRHLMATIMLAAGVPVPVVSERLCHARTSTTVNIYAHAMPGPSGPPSTSCRTPHPRRRPSCRPSRAKRRPRARPVAVDGAGPCRPHAHALSCSRLRATSTGPLGTRLGQRPARIAGRPLPRRDPPRAVLLGGRPDGRADGVPAIASGSHVQHMKQALR